MISAASRSRPAAAAAAPATGLAGARC